ncbi:MAG: hypothetical protein DYG88_04075 [Chloroflexi bacterium CFX4]|nr:hypothetical protein [Chloroflexi bacterium CFX4]MDL1921052.1 hypothetical protein [Chloroflexi bacterium CFX3]
MSFALPDNAAMLAFAREQNWQHIDETREQFLEYLSSIRNKRGSHPVSHNMIRHLSQAFYEDDDNEAPDGNVLLSRHTERPFVLATILGRRFQQGPWLDYVKPYHLNPSVIHQNIHEAGGQLALRPVGVELEVGTTAPDGSEPNAEALDRFSEAYITHAQRIGATLDISPELCIYQAEVVSAPMFGYARLLRAAELNFATLAHAAHEAGLLLQALSVYPTETDFATSHSDKVETIAIFLNEINERRPSQRAYVDALRKRYFISRGEARPANLLRFQGFHMHVDIAGRSEALGMLSYMLNLGSASAAASAALLKGGPFMDGACDPERLCVREAVRAISITGHYVGLPLSPHLQPEALERHAHLLRANLANGTARALLYGEEDGEPFSGMHNMLGRVRPDLESSKRVCTLENTGMPSNPCAERLAAVANDYQLSQVVIEHYFRRYGTNLDALYADKDLLDVFGALSREAFQRNMHESDLRCTDMVIETASGAHMSLVDFYEKKRRLLKRLLSPLNVIDTRDVDSLYDRIYHFLVAPNGGATTIDDFINHPTRRATGNWGRLLRDAYLDAGGTLGAKNPEAVVAVVRQLHQALLRRYEVI